MPAGSTFRFSLSAVGTFYINWGDGTGEIIKRTTSTATDYTHTYTTGGIKTIKFGGLATSYSTNTSVATISFKNSIYVASVDGNLSAVFPRKDSNYSPRFYETFYGCTALTSISNTLFSGITTGASYIFYRTFFGCTGLTSIPDDLFSGITTGASYMFYQTFYGCTGLTSIPDDLFSGITIGADRMFMGTFGGCTGLTSIPDDLFSGITTGVDRMFYQTFFGCTGLTSIPDDLFSGITTGASYMFYQTFYGCTGLTSIPNDLFSGITTGADNMFNGTFYGCTGLTAIHGNLFSGITTGAASMFYQTFRGCTGLTSIPGNLFSGITTSAASMFQNTFYGCTNLAGYIPPSTFAGLIANDHPTTTGMWSDTFTSTALVTGCPTGTTQYITGYEGEVNGATWNGKVSCRANEPMEITLDTTGATSGVVPSTIYVMYNGGWSSDAAGNNSISALTTLPTKTGEIFQGFYTGPNGTGTLVINKNGTLIDTTESNNALVMSAVSKLYAHFANEYTVTYSCGDGTGTPPANDTAIGGLMFTPAASTCTRANYVFMGWNVSGTNDTVSNSFRWNYNSNKTLTANWLSVPFSITTTSLAADTVFSFTMSAAGTFYIDWGDGTPLETISKTSISSQTYTHTYTTGGVKTIRYGGTATNYNPDWNTATINFSNSCDYIGAIDGNLSAIFPYISANAADGAQPRFESTFDGCSHLTAIPDTLFSGYTTASSYMFALTFVGCTGLTDIPEDLFANITTTSYSTFMGTFAGCTGLTEIPEDLFSHITTVASGTFGLTFLGCSGLTEIPSGLFHSITTGTSQLFSSTFASCTGLTEIPEDLFSTITNTTNATNMFNSTFQNCTGLTEIPEDLFSNITTGESNMFNSTFQNCTGLTEIPEDLFSNITTGTDFMFYSTFQGCTGLTAIPEDLFSGITTVAPYMFYHTFHGCTGLTSIPDDLFSGITTGANYMFMSTFSGCTGLTSIPAGLFSNISTSADYMFSNTFNGCTGVTALPENLFSGVTTAAIYMFNGTFDGCTSMAGYIPPSTFAGLIANGHPSASGMWSNTFRGTQLVTSCPTGTTQYTTGYIWEEGRKSCELKSYTCTAGNYVPANNDGCTACVGAAYCPGGTYTFSTTESQGIVACPTGYTYNTTSGKTSESQCQTHCNAGTYVDGYTRLEYIEGTGTQYINTGVSAPNGFITDANVEFTNMTKANTIIGEEDNLPGANPRRNFIKVQSNKWLLGMYTYVWGSTATANTRYHVVGSTVKNGGYIDVNDTRSASMTTNNELSDAPLLLFATSWELGSNSNNAAHMKMYDIKIYDNNNILVRDMIPVRRNSDNAVGMYDRVTNTFFANAGTGTFTAGADADTVGGQCRNVGAGYWAGESTVNYGSSSTRNACPAGTYSAIETGTSAAACTACPTGTYSDVVAGTSASVCTACPGATYSDTTGATSCTACPTGYNYNTTSGKTSISQCQIQCAGGTYVGGYTELEYIEGDVTRYISTGYTPVTNNISGEIRITPTEILSHSDIVYFGSTSIGYYQSHKFFIWNSGSTSYTDVVANANTDYDISFTLAPGQRELTINGTTLSGTNGTFVATELFLIRPHPGATFTGKIYSFKLWDGGDLVFDMVPVRRNSDGAVGMYNRVTGAFFASSGENAFIPGPDDGTADIIADNQCTDVGMGYYAGASTVNYGSVGTRTACAAGTYSNITNASACTPCAGATYADTTGSTSCTECPTGYTYNTTSGKTSASQCQIQCAGGTYVGGYTELEYIESTGTQYIDTGIKLASTDIIEARFRNTSSNQGSALYGVYAMGESSAFYANSTYYSYGSNNKVDTNIAVDTQWHTLVHDFVTGYLQLDSNRVNFAPFTFTNSVNNYLFSRFYNNAYGYNFIGEIKSYKITRNAQVIMDLIPVRRNSDNAIGMYDRVTNTFFGNAGTGTFTAGSDVGTSGVQCTDVGAGYYAAASVVNYGSIGTRSACAAGLTTVGYGHGADSANDCGHELRIGNYVLFTRRDKLTTPSINITMANGDIHYISLSTTDHTVSRVHLGADGVTQYTAYDDSLFYGERNFDTGQPITS